MRNVCLFLICQPSNSSDVWYAHTLWVLIKEKMCLNCQSLVILSDFGNRYPFLVYSLGYCKVCGFQHESSIGLSKQLLVFTQYEMPKWHGYNKWILNLKCCRSETTVMLPCSQWIRNKEHQMVICVYTGTCKYVHLCRKGGDASRHKIHVSSIITAEKGVELPTGSIYHLHWHLSSSSDFCVTADKLLLPYVGLVLIARI